MRRVLGATALMGLLIGLHAFVGCSLNDADPVPLPSLNQAPMLANPTITPATCAPGTNPILFQVLATDLDGQSDIRSVTAAETLPVNGSYTLRDDGGAVDLDPVRPGRQGSGDLIAGDRTFTALGAAPATAGTYIFTYCATDASGVPSPPLTRQLSVE